jgi:hypothetical protein
MMHSSAPQDVLSSADRLSAFADAVVRRRLFSNPGNLRFWMESFLAQFRSKVVAYSISAVDSAC